MGSPLSRIDEALGSPEAYVDVYRTRLNSAKIELDRAQQKPEGVREAAVATAQLYLENLEAEFKGWLEENPEAKERFHEGSETIQ